jgi:hypothetical protein
VAKPSPGVCNLWQLYPVRFIFFPLVLPVAIPALVGVAISTIGQSGLLNQLGSNPKDAQRFAEARGWYAQAIQGDAEALCALRHMSGRFGVSGPSCKGSARAGYATQEAKDYSYALYNQAEQVLNGQASPGSPIPLDPDQRPGSAVGQGAQVIGTVAGDVASQLGYPTKQEQQRNAAIYIGIAGVVLVLGVAIFALRRK